MARSLETVVLRQRQAANNVLIICLSERFSGIMFGRYVDWENGSNVNFCAYVCRRMGHNLCSWTLLPLEAIDPGGPATCL